LRRTTAALLVLVAVTACAYAPTLANGFTWDDEYVLLRNEAVRDLSSLPRFFADATTSAAYGGLVVYRPLRTAAFALAYGAWGMAPLGYHLANLLLHLVNVLLVYAVARRILGGAERWALLAAALFAVHPIGSEAVAGVVGLGDLLSAAFLLGALRLHLEVERVERRELPRLAAVAALFAASLLSKETALVFPLLAGWHDLVLRRGHGPVGRRRLAYLAGLAAIGAGFLALRTAIIGGLNAGSREGVTFGRTLWMQADVLARYLRLVAWPEGLSVRHSIPVPLSFFEPRTVLSVAAVLAVAGAAVLAWRRAPVVSFGIGWFFIGLAPVMNVVPLPGAMMGERFCYVPAIGLFLAAAGAVRAALGGEERLGAPARVGAAAVALALAVATFLRCREWRDNVTLFEAAVRVAPDSNVVRLNLVREYQARGLEDLARLHWAAGRANTLAYADRYVTIAERAEAAGSREEAEAWYRRALKLSPSDPRALGGVARLRGPP
jgi:protein O-mannosyl-transferase